MRWLAWLKGPKQSSGDSSNEQARDDCSDVTQFMPARDLVHVLVDEILTAADITGDRRSVRLYAMSPGRDDAAAVDRFVVLVKLRGATPDLWQYLPALGAHVSQQIRCRLGIRIEHVLWCSNAGDRTGFPKLPAHWTGDSSSAQRSRSQG